MDDKLPKTPDDWLDVVPDDADWEYYSETHGVHFPERTVIRQLHVYLPPLLLILGTVGNMMTAIVLWRFIHKVLSTCLYLFVAQVSDLVVLYFLCGNEWLTAIAYLNVRQMAMLSSNSVCKIIPFLVDLALHLSIWMVAAMSLETTLVLMRPERLMRLCRVERVRAVILLILVLLICANAHCFWTYTISDVDNKPGGVRICSMLRLGNSQQNDNFRRIAWPLVNFLVADLFPYFVVFACTVVQITVRVKRKEHLRRLENTWKAYSVDSSAARELQVSLLAVCLAHLFLLLPKMACDMFNYLVQTTTLFLVPYTFRLDAKRILAEGLGNALLYVYLSNKVFILLGCCQAFRARLWAMFACLACSAKHVTGRRRELPAPTQQPLLYRVNHTTTTAASHDNCMTSQSPRKAFSMTSV